MEANEYLKALIEETKSQIKEIKRIMKERAEKYIPDYIEENLYSLNTSLEPMRLYDAGDIEEHQFDLGMLTAYNNFLKMITT